MSQSKHTNGPWYAVTDVAEPVIVSQGAAFEPEIAVVKEIEGESEYNAHLIAAAPEMLEALKAVELWLEEYNGGMGVPQRQMLRAAIAKAEGGAQ